MKLGAAIVVLLVGFDGDEDDARLGGEAKEWWFPVTISLSSSTDGKAELSAGERSRSPVGRVGLVEPATTSVSAPNEVGCKRVICPSGISSCGIGIVDRIDCGRARFGATRFKALSWSRAM
jgi:hypothetical protein